MRPLPPGASAPITGSDRVVANFADLAAAAAMLQRLQQAVEAAESATAAASHDLELAASAAGDPVGAARVEWDLLDVRDGPSGLRWTALELAGLVDLLRLAIAAYRAADNAQSWLVEHPSAIDDVIAGITAVTGMSESQIAGDLAGLWPDGRPQVRLVARPTGPAPPRTVADLMAGLERRCDISDRWSPAAPGATAALPPGTDDGTIDVRRLSGPGGTAWIVDLPGTSDWDLLPFSGPPQAHDPADWGGNLRLMAGESTAYERGVADAMSRAGIRPGEPILLAGHSQGGMVAMALAGLLAARGLDVRSVLTAGSPIATFPRPATTSVLSLENTADVVPHLDGAPNPRQPGWTTLEFTDEVGGIGANHGFVAYAEGARLADGSDDPGVRRWLARARPFLIATASRTLAFRIQRVP